MAVRADKFPSPCLTCTRVQDPIACENKNCGAWKEWFIYRWEMIRAHPRSTMERGKAKPLGVPLGGRFYPHPEQITDYLEKDPCDGCKCPKDLCTTPCRVRRVWMEAKKEVFV